MSDAIQQSTSGPVASPQHTSKFETKGLFNTATVALHTGQAELVWNGKPTKPNLAGIRPPGAVSVALVSGALRYLFLETATDNPWTDFALLRFQDAIANVREVCAERTATIQNLIAMRAASTSVTTSLVSRQSPHVFELVLYTPYHGLLVDTIAEWDNTVRHVLTLNAAGRMDSVTTRALIESLRNLLVGALEQVMNDAGHVRRAIVPITRTLLWPITPTEPAPDVAAITAAAPARKGAASASKTLAKKFGAELPDDVLGGVRRPDHRRRMNRRRLNLPVKL
jgi:hypothetical protein